MSFFNAFLLKINLKRLRVKAIDRTFRFEKTYSEIKNVSVFELKELTPQNGRVLLRLSADNSNGMLRGNVQYIDKEVYDCGEKGSLFEYVNILNCSLAEEDSKLPGWIYFFVNDDDILQMHFETFGFEREDILSLLTTLLGIVFSKDSQLASVLNELFEIFSL